jgi:hypothetical protein
VTDGASGTSGAGGAHVRRSLGISGVLILSALVVEGVSLIWHAPLAFLLFAFLSGGLFAAGILTYLYSLVREE